MTGLLASARPQQCCRAMQVQAELDVNIRQLSLAKGQMSHMKNGRQISARAFRDEYEGVMKENVALKATAEGSQEVRRLLRH